MKSTIRRLVLLTAALMVIAVPVFAEDRDIRTLVPDQQQGSKDECMVVSMNCGERPNSIQDRIDRIQNEINKGTDVYSNEELQRLRDQLDEATQGVNDFRGGA